MSITTLSVKPDNFVRFDFLRWKNEKTTDEIMKELLDKAGTPNAPQCKAIRDRFNEKKKGLEKDAALVEGSTSEPVSAEA